MKKVSILLSAVGIMLLTLTSCSNGGKSIIEEAKYETKFIPVESSNEMFYLDASTGKKVKNHKVYDAADYFYEGRAIVKKDNKCFIIDEDFKPVGKERYKKILHFSDGIALAVKENGKINAIDKDGKVIFKYDKADYAYSFNEGVSIFFSEDGKLGAVDKKGKIIIEPKDYVSTEGINKNGNIIVKKEYKEKSKWGVIDYKGKEIIPCEYDGIARTYDEDLFMVAQENKEGKTLCGIIDKENKEVIPYRYDRGIIAQFNGTYLFGNKYDGKTRYGFLDKEGEEIGQPDFSDAAPLSMNLALVQDPETEDYGYIDAKGEWVINASYSEAEPFSSKGLAVVQNKNTSLYGVIDTKGEFVIKADYDRIRLLGEDLYIVYKSNDNFTKRGIVDAEGKEVIALTDIYNFSLPIRDDFEKINSDYVDINGTVNKITEDLKQLTSCGMNLNALSSKFNFDSSSYGKTQMNSADYNGFSTELYIHMDNGYDWDLSEYVYYGKYFSFEYSLYADKLSNKRAEIFNTFAKNLGAPTTMKSNDGYSEFESDGEEFTCPLLKNMKCMFSSGTLYIVPEDVIR